MTLDPNGHLIIVGAGLAAYHTARGVRKNGHTGPITIFGEETHPAYDRPALSKAYLTGAILAEDLHLDDPTDPLEATWISGVEVTELIPEPLGIRTNTGELHLAEAIVITTGASAATLPQPSQPERGNPIRPYVLRTMEDALALREANLEESDVVVVGGGFLALETAATCVSRGAKSVTVAAGEDAPGARRLGGPVAEAIKFWHETHGVTFAPAAKASAFNPHGQARRHHMRTSYPSAVPSAVTGTPDSLLPQHEVLLTDGTTIPGDVVICAIGASPRTNWLEDSPLVLTEYTRAVLCDDSGATSIPGVYAAGDCAQWSSHSSGLRPVGHWQEAVEEAAVIAATLTGTTEAALQEPYFWSDQFNLRIQGAGRIHLADRLEVADGSAESGHLLVRYYKEDQEIGILGINRLRDVTKWRKQRRIRARQQPDTFTQTTSPLPVDALPVARNTA